MEIIQIEVVSVLVKKFKAQISRPGGAENREVDGIPAPLLALQGDKGERIGGRGAQPGSTSGPESTVGQAAVGGGPNHQGIVGGGGLRSVAGIVSIGPPKAQQGQAAVRDGKATRLEVITLAQGGVRMPIHGDRSKAGGQARCGGKIPGQAVVWIDNLIAQRGQAPGLKGLSQRQGPAVPLVEAVLQCVIGAVFLDDRIRPDLDLNQGCARCTSCRQWPQAQVHGIGLVGAQVLIEWHPKRSARPYLATKAIGCDHRIPQIAHPITQAHRIGTKQSAGLNRSLQAQIIGASVGGGRGVKTGQVSKSRIHL